jgi:signal transduction histidine kinase
MAEKSHADFYLKPHVLIFMTLGAVFIVELFIMFLIRQFLTPLPVLAEAFLDSFLLIVLIIPVFYYFFYKPLSRSIEVRKRTEIEKEKIQEINRIKSEFIALASHELRTPLTTIMGYSELLLSEIEFDCNQRQEFITIINQKSETMERLIDDLLDFSRMEQGHPLRIEKAEFDIVSTISSFINNCRANHPQRRFEVQLPGTPVYFSFDKIRLEQVLDNILSNAIKFSPPESPIEIEGEVRDEDFHLWIRDRGIGLSPQELNQIFDKFYRGNNSGSSPAGLGLGMTIVREIIGLHGGEIRLESMPGEGTTVHCSLPISR